MTQPESHGQSLARRLKSKWTGPVVGALLAVLVGLFLLKTAGGQKLTFFSYDLPFYVRPSISPQEVVLVLIDDASFRALNQDPLGIMDRKYHAQLLRRLTKEKARAVVFDLVFSNPSETNSDREFIEAVKENGKVILAADKILPTENVPGVSGISFVTAFPALGDVAADFGSDQMPCDDDGIPRQHLPVMKDDPIKSLPWATASFLHAPVTTNESTWYHPRWFNYYGPHQVGVIPFVSYYRALEVDSTVPEGLFSNKVVFVGAHYETKVFGDRKDEYLGPFPNRDQENKFMPGVEVHATAFLNLLRGDWLNRLSGNSEWNLTILLGILFGAGLALLRPVTAVGLAVLLGGLVAVTDYLLVTRIHYWYPWLIIVLGQLPVALIWSVSFNTVQLYVEKRLVEQSLSLYLSPKLVKKFAKDPTLLKPGALKQTLTILFSDIAGFTTISEGMDPDELARLMNEYFQSAVSHCIHETDGTVVKYIGDAIFAFWNAPDPQGDHAYLACDAALRFRALPVQTVNGTELVTRIGLHTGVANVGNFGSTARVDYTAIGESINLASRMEGLNKYLGTRVLITGETQREAGARLVTRYLGLFRLKGFEKAVAVYELLGYTDKEEVSKPLRESFALALDAFTKQSFAAAEVAFNRLLQSNGRDGPSKFYLEQIAELREAELPPDWKGEIILKDK